MIIMVLVCGQEAFPVANKSEYIREGYALRKSVKGLKYKKQKKENWMFCKVYKENQKELEKCTTSVVCVSYEFDLQQKKKQKKLILYQPSKEVIVP